MFSCSHQYHSDRGRYLDAVQVVLVVTLINCSMSASNGQTSTERVKTELERKLECLKQKIATCGISDNQTDCKEYEDIQKLTENTKDVDITEAHDFLVKLAPNATHMCTAALGLYCHRERKKCTKFFYHDDVFDNCRTYVEKLSWMYEDNDDDNDNCAEFGTDYERCPLPEFPDHPSTIEEIKQLACLYKKVVTCGITDNKTVCKSFESENKIDLKEMAAKIAGQSLEDIHTKQYNNMF